MRFLQNEFEIEPESGTIDPVGFVEIKISFTPSEIKKYEEALAVDVLGVGDELLLLPIRAVSIVPEVSTSFRIKLTYANIELVNETAFPAHYELMSQEESAKNVYAYASKNGIGVIHPFSTQMIQVDVQIKRLGQINFPVFIKIRGNEDMPLGIDIAANGIGPNVILSTSELNWGKIPVLKDVPLYFTLTNDSPIPANFTCATVSESSVFRVFPNIGVIASGAVTTIEVIAYLDDCLKFTDILKIGIQSDGIHEVQLVARGQGSTITFDEALRNVDFSDVFSNRECSREFVLVNKGRRSQTLHWSTEEDRFARKDLVGGQNQVFEVFPSRFSMKPNQQQIIVIKGYASKAIKCRETLVCQGTIDKDPARRVIVESVVIANFINPLIEVQPPLLKFISAHTSDEDFKLLSQELTLTNVSTLPLHLSFKCPIPYSVEPNEVDHRLNQGESIKIDVRYDPRFNTNRVSCKEHAKLLITYSEHPQRDFVELFSEVTFPNLTFSSQHVNFGCIPNDTEQKRSFTMSNCSSLPVEYNWGFLESSVDGILADGQTLNTPISQVFDILPTRGTLQPGETELVEVTFNGHSGGTYSVTALCDVVGGPKYELVVKGEASTIEYSIDKNTLDFGTQPYQDILEQDIILSNTGKVNFEFNTVIFPTSSLSQKIMVIPSSGTILPHGRQRLTVKFCPTVPEPIDDSFFLQLAFYEPFKIRVVGVGVFPHIQMTIPRVPDPGFEALLNETKLSFSKHRKKLSEGLEAEIEAETERLLLKKKTLEFLETLSDEIRSKGAWSTKSKMIGSPILIQKFLQNQKAAKEKKSINSINESSHVRLTTYLCNFGNVIRNTSRKKTFKLINKSHYPISFTLDKSVLTGTGFSIDPDRVKSLPGHPHYESAEFQVTFQARSQSIGAIQVDVPIIISGGPTTILSLRADVTLPDLYVSSTDVDFGEVLCGQRKTITIQLHNKNSVPCEWTTTAQDSKEIASSKQAKQTKKRFASIVKEFGINPPNGLLQPGERMLVFIQFSPTEEKDYDAVVPFKVNMNGQPIPVHISGRGFKPVIQFEPDSIVMGPILPCSEGTESKFCIYNPTNYPIEVYSLEFDQVYLEEEEMLRNIDGYDGNALFLPPREPGQGLPDNIVEVAQLKMKQKIYGAITPPEPGTQKGEKDAAVGELVETGGIRALRPVAQDSGNDSTINIFLHGPPFSGRTTQARKLQKCFGFAYLKIDEVIETSSHMDLSLYLDSAKSKDQARGSSEAAENVSSVRVPGIATEDMHKAVQSENYDQFDQRTTIPDDIITEIFKSRLQKEDCIRGIVIDGLESKYSHTSLTLLKAILRALGDKRKVFFFSFAIDAAHIKEREANLARQAGDKDLDPMQVKDVTEEEYDNMTEIERENYDIALIRYRKKVKELQDRKKLERKLWEEEMALRIGERKAEEESTKHKKKGPRRLTRTQGFQLDKEKPSNTQQKAEAKQSKFEKGNTSPKLGRKPQLDKNADRFDGKDKFDRIGADADEYSSRYTLNDFSESFLNDSTFKRFESYNSTLDPILLYVREGEKHSTRQISASTAVEKKPIKSQKVPFMPTGAVAGLASSEMASNMSMSTDETHMGDESASVTFHEVNGCLDEDTVSKSIADFIPSTPKVDEVAKDNFPIPVPFIQQIVYYPQERELPTHSRFFQLQPPPLSTDSEDDNSNANESAVSAAIGQSKADGANQNSAGQNTVGGNLSTTSNANTSVGATGASATTATSGGKKVRPSFKVTEDTKITEVEEEPEKDSPARYRWILMPKERKELVVKFASNEIGKFEQTLQFEIVGSRNKFSLSCIGHCRYSQIVNDYKKVFPKWRKSKEEKTIPHGEYIASSSTFEFGPLLYSKPREKYLEKFPENRAILNVINPSQQEIKVTFALRNDVKSEVFFFDPPAMDLGPGQTQPFQLWAYPRSANYFEDLLIICVKDNPEPYCFKISCVGVKPELEIDKRQLSFDKMLLGRSERREIKLRNNTLMPVAWKLVQVELLGDEFTITPLEGVIDPFLEQIVTAEFKGNKPVVISRRSIRLEVSDTDKIGGVVQEVPILVTAEAYDIAMDLHFPKGYEGGLDFGVLKVLEEGKQQCTLKNKGKYEVGYRFAFESKELSELFTITPQQGIMQPSDKPFPVQVIFKANREMIIKDNTCLKCQFFEPITMEVTATISVKLSARAVFSRFSILPVREVNFGALVFGTKMTRQFTVENQGEFDFRFSIYKIIHGTGENRQGNKLRTNSRPSKNGRATSPPTQKVMNRKELVKQADAANFGAFTVFPTNGIVASGTKMQITVEFHSDTPGCFEEIVAIDISDRSPNDYLDVIEYRLIGESCVPGINTSDFASIFEEQTVCKRLELFNTQANVYAEEDRVFYFGAYLAGQQAQVRFKISNPYKVPCDVAVATKPRSRTKSDAADFAFDVEPKKLVIPSHEHRYITVSFHPTSIQSYAGILEAVVENVDQTKTKTLYFEIRGEGTLPRVTIEKPSLRNKTGLPFLKFKRLLVGSNQTAPVVLRNEGIIPAKVKLEWGLNENNVFECLGIANYHMLKPQEIKSIDMKFRPTSIQKFEGELRVRVIDNSFEDAAIQIAGEGYVDDVTFDGLPSDNDNELSLGDCMIGEMKQVAFTATNHSTDIIRLSWVVDVPDFVFSPSVAHIRPKGQKEISVLFCPKQPMEIHGAKAVCKTSKIRYLSQTIDPDWDDRIKSVRWQLSDSKAGQPRKILEQYPEPTFDTVANSTGEHQLLLTALADYANYECDVANIRFKNTFMYQTRESLWKFIIVGHDISIPFLLVGQALEPNIYMDRVSVNFRSLLVGRQVKECVKLINSEDMPFAFSFNETSSELGTNGVPVLRFSPSSGTIASHSEVPIEIIFCPSAEKVFNFNLICNVKKKPSPVTLNVKGEGYEIHESIQGEMADGTVFELVSTGQNGENTMDFGQVQINEKRLKRVTVVNSGKFNFDFSWKLPSKPGLGLSISPEIGSVGKGERVVCEITFNPTNSLVLKNVKALCQIINGRSYPITILGSGCKPLVRFSTTNHDFGTSFIHKSGMTPASTKIRMTNDDVSEITFDVLSLETGILDIQKSATNLGPGESTDLEVTFYPREARAYREIVKVEINGLSTVDLVFTGIGAEFKVEVSQADSRTVNFGAIRIGHVVTRSIKIINKSVIPATFSLGTPSTIENLLTHFVSLSQSGECTLRPRGVLNLELKFQPQHRIPAFSEEIIMEAPGISRPLFLVSGACQGIEVKLENDTLPFGAVVQRSCTTRRIQLQNVGDIGAKFHWDISKFLPDFSITPTEGYISPGMDISLEITFHPVEINQDIRYENLVGTIEGTTPLYLTLTGMCIPQPIQNDIIKFSTPVRQSEVKSIKLDNKTSIPWHIRPIIENEHWSGPEIIDIEPGQSKTYDITFTPLEMVGSGDAGRHEGSIFFPLPDGSGILYKLYGVADKPLTAGTISREIPCKTSYTEILSVLNWLKRPQRFKVIIEVAKPDSSIILKGHDFIDVPALVSRDYKLNFYAYKEGLTNAKIVFKNEQTQEFMFYNVTFKSTPPGIISTLELTTPVRQMATKEVVISNPLPTAVSFSAVCNHPDISITHSFVVQPRSDGICSIEFLPLQAKESTARLTISSNELGVYQYDLRLVSTPAGVERSLHFKVGLGGSQTQTFRFLSYSKTKTEYTCKVDSPDFTVEKSVVAPSAVNGGVEVCIDVTYEPSKLGDVRTQLLVSSPSGGDYICPLYGHCIPPRPQGPITIKQGSTASVPFKNVFSTTATFNFVVDNPAFSVKATEAIASKRVITMVIQAHAPTPGNNNEPRSAKVGKLTVTHKGGSNVSWIYYLRTQAPSSS
ncbi:hypothetical protein HDU96_001327 [Phlyctochytrium bullatum]|nr:hypothetical protein HDU96_001327 [Phlyctochytrium bullatum]